MQKIGEAVYRQAQGAGTGAQSATGTDGQPASRARATLSTRTSKRSKAAAAVLGAQGSFKGYSESGRPHYAVSP